MLSPEFNFPSTLRLALIGTGALGSEVCRLLLRRRQQDVFLIDPDALEPHNLALSELFSHAGITACGRPKVEVLSRLAREAGLHWQAFHGEIADLGLTRLQGVDVLLCCPDSALARVETTFAARALGLPLCDAGVQSDGMAEGRVTWFAPQPAAACYLCGLPEARRGELLAFAQSASLGCSVPTVAAMTGSRSTVQRTALALLDLLDEATASRPSTSFARRIERGQPAAELALSRSGTCPWHDFRRLEALPCDEPVHTLLVPGAILEFPWPMCLDARCQACGHRFAPRQRTALVRRRLRCPACHGLGTLEPLQSLSSLAASDPLATQTLCQLGLPAGHLYHRRSAVIL